MRTGWCVFAGVLVMLRAVWSAPAASLQTAQVRIGLDASVVTHVVNRLTNETLSVRSAPALTGIRHLRGGELWNDRAQLQQSVSRNTLALNMRWHSNGLAYRLKTRFSALPSGEIAVDQRAECTQPGLIGLQWGLALPNDWDVLLPAHSGLRLNKETHFEPLRLEYPFTWESQFVLLQGRRGGFLIYAQDDARRFKRLFVQHRDGQFWLGFETWCTAPFERVRQESSVRWHIRAYRGTWLVGASLYREWAAKQFGLTKLRQLQPAWVKDIQTVVIGNLDDRAWLEALAKQVNPRQTLLYVPDWRRDGYDRNYPDYTPKADFPAQMRRAKQLGFRVMLHVNYFGVTPENPAYTALKPYHMRDPFSGEYLYWDWQRADPPIKFAYINPASKAWRRLFVQRMVELYNQLQPDALHLDQTLVIPNDHNGIIDGMNTMQGNIALHRELLQALPGVAISGEGLNEVTFRYESFAQRHVWGINHADASWDMTMVRMAHPVSSSLLTPHTKVYGYLGMTSPQQWQYYVAWRTAYERLGVLPTFAWMPTRFLSDPDPALQMLWSEARWFQVNRPVADFSLARWTENTVFVYRTVNGQIGRYVGEPAGIRLEHVTPAGAKVVYRRIERATKARVQGSIPGWLAYNGRELLALNPQHGYAWLPDAPDLNALHLHAVPETLSLREASLSSERWARFALQGVEELVAGLWGGNLTVSHCVNDADSVGKPASGMLWEHKTGAVARPLGENLFMHPPWQSSVGGDVWLEFTVQLPSDRDCEFRSKVGFTAADAARRSDGITFTVTALGKDETLSEKRHVQGSVPEEIVLDLSALRGQRIRLRLQVHPGPNGSPDFDWGQWTRPRLVERHREPQWVEVHSPMPVLRACVNGISVTGQAVAPQRYRFAVPSDGAKLVLLFTEPEPVSLPVSLTSLPFDTGIELDGSVRGPVDYMRGAVDRGACGGVTREGFSAHPPPLGSTYMTFLLRLPEQPARLLGFAGIGDGAEGKSNGVRFSVEVNGKEVFGRVVNPGEGWVPVQVSLAEWAGQTVLLRLTTDALGDFGWDWARWGDIRIE